MEKLLSDEKQPITEYEADFFFTAYLVLLVQNNTNDINSILAFEEYVKSLDSFYYHKTTDLFSAVQAMKMRFLVDHFIKTGELSQ
jgi:hypothetical protein